MMPLVLIACIAGLPVLLALLFRVNAALLFLAIASGALLERSIGMSTELALSAIVRNGPVSYVAHIGLFALPVVLTLFFLRKSAKSSQMLLQILPLIAACAAFAVLLLPMLPAATQSSIYGLSFGTVLRRSQDVIVAVAVGLNLLFAWRVFRHKTEDAKHSKH